MNIEYQNTIVGANWEHVCSIFDRVGWGVRSANRVESAFKSSSFVRFAYSGEELVGFGRTVDDGSFYGWVVDLVVHPDYQRLGIGKHILRELEADLKPFITTMLVAAQGANGFYEKQGWHKIRSAYIYPRSEKQIDIFADPTSATK